LFGGRALPGPAWGAKAFPDSLAAIRGPTSKEGREKKEDEGRGRTGRGWKGRKMGVKGNGGGREGREGEEEGQVPCPT